MIKVVIIGPESTGKSTLAEDLAQHYQTDWVPEYARHYIDKLDRPYVKADLVEIAKGQLEWENRKAKLAESLLICDTDLRVIKIWSEHKYKSCDPWILKQIENQTYDFYLLTDIDLPWEEDPQRENPNLRDFFMKWFEAEVKKSSIPFKKISGNRNQRKKSAIKAIDQLLENKNL